MSEVEESPRFITASYGRQRSLFLFHFLESDQKKLKTCLTLAPHSPRNNMKSALGQVNWMARAFPGNMSIKFSGTLLYTQVERGTDMVCETQRHSPPLSLGFENVNCQFCHEEIPKEVLNGMLVYPQHKICWYPFIHLGRKRQCESKLCCPRTQQCLYPGFKPGPLDLEEFIIMRPPCLHCLKCCKIICGISYITYSF